MRAGHPIDNYALANFFCFFFYILSLGFSSSAFLAPLPHLTGIPKKRLSQYSVCFTELHILNDAILEDSKDDGSGKMEGIFDAGEDNCSVRNTANVFLRMFVFMLVCGRLTADGK